MKCIESDGYEHFVLDSVEIPVRREKQTFQLHIVYFIHCLVNPNWLEWLTAQLNMVTTYTPNIHIVATLHEEMKEDFVKECRKICPHARISGNCTNQFEYPGILKVWELAQIHRDPNDIFLYFHSKGVTRYLHFAEEYRFYDVILQDIHRIYNIYSTFPTIDKIGMSAGGCGWIWYNFWYARGSYLCQVEKPVLTPRRHYYENWLGLKVGHDSITAKERPWSFYPNTRMNCYGFHTDKLTVGNIGNYYCAYTNKMISFDKCNCCECSRFKF